MMIKYIYIERESGDICRGGGDGGVDYDTTAIILFNNNNNFKLDFIIILGGKIL